MKVIIISITMAAFCGIILNIILTSFFAEYSIYVTIVSGGLTGVLVVIFWNTLRMREVKEPGK